MHSVTTNKIFLITGIVMVSVSLFIFVMTTVRNNKMR